MGSTEALSKLPLEGVIGFSGNVPNGLKYLPGGRHALYPLGRTVVLRDLETDRQIFMEGHDNKVSCTALSHDGKLLATGQETHLGFKATIVVWDVEATLETGEAVQLHRLTLHKVFVRDMAFSPDDTFLASLGGRDDNNLVIWHVKSGEPVCGSPAASASAECLAWYKTTSARLVTAGQYHARIWDFDPSHRKLRPTDCRLGSVKRVFSCVTVSDSDDFIYCGSLSGEVFQLNAHNGRFVTSSARRYQKGIISIDTFHPAGAREDHLVIGSGSGTIATLIAKRGEPLEEERITEVQGGVTTLSVDTTGRYAYVGTSLGNTMLVELANLHTELRGTSHPHPVRDVCFPQGTSAIFVTCAGPDIRIWNTELRQELLRIQVPNLECLCVALTPEGGNIVSGWSDGKIRTFLPESGRLAYVITDAHTDAITALAVTANGTGIVSGGRDGRVRMWEVGGPNQRMIGSFKEHKGTVTYLALNASGSSVISASADGSCIEWDIDRLARETAVFANTKFQAVCLIPDESQFVTCGSDHRLTYWDAAEGSAIRVVEASESALTCLDLDDSGEVMVMGGEDATLRLISYDEGLVRAEGVAHSDTINRVKISPDSRYAVSVGEEGAICIWRLQLEEGAPAGK